MKFLLDTHVLLWFLDPAGFRAINLAAQNAITDPVNSVTVSAVSVAEVFILEAANRIGVPSELKTHSEFYKFLGKFNFTHINITIQDIYTTVQLPRPRNPRHKDPCDRMLVAQAKNRDLTLITKDRDILALGSAYNVNLLNAR